MNTSNWTGRAPRTLNEAFGPYTSEALEPLPEAPDHRTGVVVVVCLVLALLAVAFLLT